MGSLLDDARKMAELEPAETDRAGYGECLFCSAPNYEGAWPAAGRFKGIEHNADCPRLVMSRIVAALKAAELVTIAAEEERVLFGVRAGSQLVVALEKLDEAMDA